MKRIFAALILIAFTAFNMKAGEYQFEGYFQGANVYVMNPTDESGEGFCVTDVKVNGKKAIIALESNAFEIVLTESGFKQGDEVNIVFKHKDGCSPKILNMDALKPVSSFVVTSMNVDQKGILHWTAIEEHGKLPYRVQQRRWETWVTIGEVSGIGTATSHSYSFDLFSKNLRPHSDVNTYRISQVDYTRKPRYSQETQFRSKQEKVKHDYDSKIKKVTFTETTSYQIVNGAGEVAKEGYGKEVNLNDLKNGKYFLNYDVRQGARINIK